MENIEVISKPLLTPMAIFAIFKAVAPFFLFMLIFGGVALFFKHKLGKLGKSENRRHFEVKPCLPFTEREQEFYSMAKQVFQNEILLSQVDIKRLVKCQSGNNRAYMDTIGQLSVDFVLLNKEFQIITCIELDDSTHDVEPTLSNDKNKSFYLDQAGIPLTRFSKMPKPEDLKKRVEAITKSPTSFQS
ncbi:MAG: DUF2726 domain-containing protein [Nitrospinae bacterium]|nr:DUF2726 domain-containing protein [Nitrospinota bacterium]